MTDYRNHDLLYFGRERENLGWNGMAIFGAIGLAMTLLVAAYLVILGSGPEAYSRFRVPFVPVICVFAAAGAFHVRQRVIAWSAQRSR